MYQYSYIPYPYGRIIWHMLKRGFCTFMSKLKVKKTHWCSLKMREIRLYGARKRCILDQVLILSLWDWIKSNPCHSFTRLLLEVVFLLPLGACVIHSPPGGLHGLCKNELGSAAAFLKLPLRCRESSTLLWAPRLYNIVSWSHLFDLTSNHS